jgi:hypothetical protein
MIAIPNEKGIVEVALKEGKYSFTATTPGYETVEGTLSAAKGTIHREGIIIKKAAGNTAVA